METLVVSSLNAIAYGFIIFIISAGLSLTLGTMQIVNLTHASYFMVASYVGVTVVQKWGSFGIGAIPCILSACLLGLILERGFLRYLHKLFNAQVLLTFGFVYMLTNLCLWIWGPWPKMARPPSFLAGSVDVGEFHFPMYRIAAIFAGLIVAAGLWVFQERTRVGAIIRAGMDDKEMVTGLGIDYDRICTVVFCAAAGLAGLAGIIALPILGAYLESSIDILLLALSVVVIGGMGSVQGALLGSMLISIVNTLGIFYFEKFGMFTTYLLMIIILLVRPSGLLGRKLV